MGQATEAIETRYLVRRDLPDVMAIENGSFDCPWEESDFVDCLKSRTVTGLVVEREDAVIAFVIYELEMNVMHVLNMAVHPAFRREGIGSSMLSKLISKLMERRPVIEIEVREQNVDCQLFLKRNDFVCYGIKDEFFDNGESAYRFRYNLFGLDQ